MSALSENWSQLLVKAIAIEIVQQIQPFIETNSKIFPAKLTFDEAEAADILGIPRHVLKGCRERGEISPVKIGKKWHYSREILVAFAASGAN